jgi:putative ABC transport system substrate-binding protein
VNHRAIVALGVVLLAVATGAAAQDSGQVRIVGVMRASSFGRDDPTLRPLSNALREFGYVEGRDYRLEQLSARNQPDRLPVLAQELVRRRVDVIVATTTVAAQAGKEATATIPIVMIEYGRDPVAAGLVQTLARPGGNVTGVSALQQDLIGKRLELPKEMLPGLSESLSCTTPRLGGSRKGWTLQLVPRGCSFSVSRCAGRRTSTVRSGPPRKIPMP